MDYHQKRYFLNMYCQELSWNDNLSTSDIIDLIKSHKYYEDVISFFQIDDDFLRNRIDVWKHFHEKDKKESKYDSNFILLRVKIFSLITNKNDISKEEILQEIDPIILKELYSNIDFKIDKIIDYIRKIICD